MYCPQCGETSKDSDRFCHACGLDLSVYRRPASGAEAGPPPDGAAPNTHGPRRHPPKHPHALI
jgi:predicted amidophosphoribosyltransferase